MAGDYLSCAHSLAFPIVSWGQINTKLVPIDAYIRCVNDCPKIQKKKCDEGAEKECAFEAYLIFSPVIGWALVQSVKPFETARLRIMECYSVMQCLDNKHSAEARRQGILLLPLKNF